MLWAKIQTPEGKSWKISSLAQKALCLPHSKHPHIPVTDMFAAKHSSILRATASGTVLSPISGSSCLHAHLIVLTNPLTIPPSCSCPPYLCYHWLWFHLQEFDDQQGHQGYLPRFHWKAGKVIYPISIEAGRDHWVLTKNIFALWTRVLSTHNKLSIMVQKWSVVSLPRRLVKPTSVFLSLPPFAR